ncbi:hypothetical protein AB0F81_02395 [Actinoplanes sp. NPDC024001]|uniref:hypothetical protein n=1 Tax=Actinoplanes sp. NPDC024001 TaxID=3154598 RepID=UPI0034061E12
MRQLSDLLREAKVEGPPLRYDVDDVVAAGRSRRRRRNSGWALAAVVAVAASIGVPQILARPQTRPSILPAVPSPTAATPDLLSLSALSQPYTVGDLRIERPDTVGLDGSMAEIRRSGTEVGRLWILRPEIIKFPWGTGTTVDTATINGRPAKWVRATSGDDGPEYLQWEYADGATAVVWPGRELSRAQAQAVAEAFVPAPAQPALIGFRVDDLPGDYRLITAGTVIGRVEPMRLTFLTSQAAEARLRDAQVFGSATERPGKSITVSLTRAGESKYPDGKVRCADLDCYRWDKSAGVLFKAHGDSVADLRQVLGSVSPAADLDDRGTWFPVDDAVPVSARLPRR